MKESKEDLAIMIGSRVKEARKRAGLTLKQLADATELTSPFLSRVENGLLMPSIPTLRTISLTLRVDIEYFFRSQNEKGYVISRGGSRKAQTSDLGFQLELVFEQAGESFLMFMEPAVLISQKSTQPENWELVTHEGQEFMYVLEGKLELLVGKERHVMKKDDAAYWQGKTPHKVLAMGKKPVRTLNVHLVPGKRGGTFRLKSDDDFGERNGGTE